VYFRLIHIKPLEARSQNYEKRLLASSRLPVPPFVRPSAWTLAPVGKTPNKKKIEERPEKPTMEMKKQTLDPKISADYSEVC
jgi:hypothetical protein